MIYLVNFTLRRSYYMGDTKDESKQRLVEVSDAVSPVQAHLVIAGKLDMAYKREDSYGVDVMVRDIEAEPTL